MRHLTAAGTVALPALLALLSSACATARPAGLSPGGAEDDLGERLAARARSELGRTGPFTVGDERFPADCSGYVAAVYQAEGVPLRRLAARAAPGEASGVAAAYRASGEYGVVFGGGGEWPKPGDLVFFHDTYDRNRNGLVDDPFTHVGIVEGVDGGTVAFLHRGRSGVARGVLTLERPSERRDADGRELNSILRDKRPRLAGEPSLAGELFMAFGRIDPRRAPRELAER